MLRKASELKGYAVVGQDGAMGSITDLYFDDTHWAVRHLVVDTGGWLTGRLVLLSPRSVQRIDGTGGAVHFDLSRKRIEDSPDIATDKPISRQQEMLLHDHYGYPYYWAGPDMWGAFAYPAMAPMTAGVVGSAAITSRGPVAAAPDRGTRAEGDPHLRSSQEVMGYTIQATDDTIGHVEDLLIDDEDWSIALLMIDTRNWWPGRKVVVSPDRIREIRWGDSTAVVDLSRDEVERSPEFDPAATSRRAERASVYRPY